MTKETFFKLLLLSILILIIFGLSGCANQTKVLVTETQLEATDLPTEFRDECTKREMLPYIPTGDNYKQDAVSIMLAKYAEKSMICELGLTATFEFQAGVEKILAESKDPKTVKEKIAALYKKVKDKFSAGVKKATGN